MSLLIFCLIVLVVVGIVCAVVYQVPLPAGLLWLRWAVPCIALLIALILIVQKAGLA